MARSESPYGGTHKDGSARGLLNGHLEHPFEQPGPAPEIVGSPA